MPTLWALADLHLCLSTPSKTMEVFGPEWKGYIAAMEQQWKACVSDEDLILLPGDISWAMKLERMEEDLAWIEELPGTKVLIRGNHDYWWSSLSKMQKFFPPSIHVLHQSVYNWRGISIAGARLWDTPEVTFDGTSDYIPPPQSKEELAEEKRIFDREVERLKRSLEQLDPHAQKRVVMTHYPPIDPKGTPTVVSKLFQHYRIDYAVFGHLHKLKPGLSLYDQIFEGTHYALVASDYLRFKPFKIYSV